MRIELRWLRARAAIALAREDASRRDELLRDAEGCGRRLVAEEAVWAKAVGHVALAGVFSVKGHKDEARRRLEQGARLATQCGSLSIAVAARRCMGDRPTEGPDSAASDAIARPDRWAMLMTPGLN